MDVGIALPNAVPGTRGDQLTEWARRADARGFSTLGTIDRIAYPNYEPLTALAAAAAATERIGLSTTVLLAPLRPNAVELAKRALSLQALSDGRLTFGLGLGARGDDYEISGLEERGRGERFDRMLETIRETWAGDRVGPAVERPPRLIVGGSVDASFDRAARYGEGWIAGGSGPEEFARMAAGVRSAWAEAGREDEPHLMALAYFGLGERGEEEASAYLNDYYAWLGEDIAGAIAGAAATDPGTVEQYLAAYEGAGCTELVFCPGSGDPAQVDLLADAVGL